MTDIALPLPAQPMPASGNGAESDTRADPRRAALSYLAHFGFTAPPFGLTPDTDFFHASPPHQEALNTLLYALDNGEGFIKIVGAVGTGKTLLCRILLARLPERVHAIYLPNPALDPTGILFAVAAELGFTLTGNEAVFRVHKAIQLRLLALAKRNIHVVMVVDEAQAVSLESLESIRLLSNLETEKRKLLTIMLFGQPELDAQLEAIPQLKTRISFHDRLRPLNRDELPAYLTHRLTRAGYGADRAPLFSAQAIRALHATSDGVPRVVNVIAHKALMLAYGRGESQVNRQAVKQAARDTLAAVSSTPRRVRIIATLGVLVAAAAGVVWYLSAWT